LLIAGTSNITSSSALSARLEAEITEACGPKGKHNPDRVAVRHGTEKGSVTLGGRRVSVTRPRGTHD
jgi:putative transposase